MKSKYGVCILKIDECKWVVNSEVDFQMTDDELKIAMDLVRKYPHNQKLLADVIQGCSQMVYTLAFQFPNHFAEAESTGFFALFEALVKYRDNPDISVIKMGRLWKIMRSKIIDAIILDEQIHFPRTTRRRHPNTVTCSIPLDDPGGYVNANCSDVLPCMPDQLLNQPSQNDVLVTQDIVEQLNLRSQDSMILQLYLQNYKSDQIALLLHLNVTTIHNTRRRLTEKFKELTRKEKEND